MDTNQPKERKIVTLAEIRTAIMLLATSPSFRVTARRRVVGVVQVRYFDFRIWLIRRRIWRRVMKTWAMAFARDLRFVVKATVAVIRHHLTARPRYASAEWQAFIDYLERDFNYRHGHSDTRLK